MLRCEWRPDSSARPWAVVAGAFLVTMVDFGAIYSHTAFADEIAGTFGSSRASVSVVYGLSGCSCFFVSALSGPLSDRIGARVLAAIGMVLVGLGLLVAAAARSLIEVYVGYGLLIGLGCGFAYVPALASVQRSFDAHRGLASGSALLGRGFALAYMGTLLVSVTVALPHGMLVGTASDSGLGRQDALALLGLIGIGTIVGRFMLAAVADVVGRRAMFLLCCGGTAASMMLWAAATDELALQAFALGFGMLQGGFVALLPAFVADSFGQRSLGLMLGVLYTSRGIALVAAPPALALGIAITVGHEIPVMAAGLLGLLGTLLLARVQPNERPIEVRGGAAFMWRSGVGGCSGPISRADRHTGLRATNDGKSSCPKGDASCPQASV